MRLTLGVLTRLLSTLAALALIGLGAVILIDVVSAWLGRGRTVVSQRAIDEAGRRLWDDRTVVTTLAVAGLIGLLLLLVGVWRRAALTVPVAGHPEAGVERRGLEQAVTRRLTGLDGVSGASVRAGRRKLTARIDTARRLPPTELRARAETELAAALSAYGVELPTQIRVRQPEARPTDAAGPPPGTGTTTGTATGTGTGTRTDLSTAATAEMPVPAGSGSGAAPGRPDQPESAVEAAR